MRFTNWLLLLPTLCLGFVILISFVIFFVFRRGRQAIDQLRDNADDEMPDPEAAMQADTRWARGNLADNDALKNTIEMSACPACGGENITGSGICAYCGRKL